MSTVTIATANRQLSQLINRAAYSGEILILTSRGRPKAVLLGMEAFEELVNMRQYAERPLMLYDAFQSRFREALEEAGFGSREKIVELVREVKREIADERVDQR